MERLRFKRETDLFNGEGGEENQAGGARVVFGRDKSPNLPHFIDEKDDLDSYLLRLRDMLHANWPQAN